MKRGEHNSRRWAFTLTELLVVIAIIGILAALLLPVLARSQARARRVWCIHDLQQLGVAFHTFAHDHGGNFPMAVPLGEGGSKEFVANAYLINGPFYFAYRHFQTLSSELVKPTVLLCPADTAREAAADFPTLQNTNVSYFVGVEAKPAEPNSILAGDRNIERVNGLTQSLLRTGSGQLRWTREMHEDKGNILFADGHVEEWGEEKLGEMNSASRDLFLPTANLSGKNPMPAIAAQPTLMPKRSDASLANGSPQPPQAGQTNSPDSGGTNAASAGTAAPKPTSVAGAGPVEKMSADPTEPGTPFVKNPTAKENGITNNRLGGDSRSTVNADQQPQIFATTTKAVPKEARTNAPASAETNQEMPLPPLVKKTEKIVHPHGPSGNFLWLPVLLLLIGAAIWRNTGNQK